MTFGETPVADAAGAILAHKLYDAAGKLVFNKGHLLRESDLAALRRLGLERVIVMRLSDADLHEDEAARRIGLAVAGENVKWRTPGVGRANITAEVRGIAHVNVPHLEKINNIHDGITIATLRQYSLVDAGDMIALVKVVPFGVPLARVIDVERIAATGAVLRVAPLKAKRVALIVSGAGSDARTAFAQLHGAGAPTHRKLGQRSFCRRCMCRTKPAEIAAAIRDFCDMPTSSSRPASPPLSTARTSCQARCESGWRQRHRAWRAGRPRDFADARLPGRNAGGGRARLHQVAKDQCHRLDFAAPADRREADSRRSGVDGAWRLAARHRRASHAAQPVTDG